VRPGFQPSVIGSPCPATTKTCHEPASEAVSARLAGPLTMVTQLVELSIVQDGPQLTRRVRETPASVATSLDPHPPNQVLGSFGILRTLPLSSATIVLSIASSSAIRSAPSAFDQRCRNFSNRDAPSSWAS